ncbi:MAG: DUF3592 domain-containing protein [Oscillospiraceae bacterium]|nr:DUF3592 domain-containing protein [Oscillospiraceae bacterium]
MWMYIAVGVIVLAIAVGIIYTAKRNNEIKQNGIETDATVTRVKEHESSDEYGHTTGISYTYYVTYRMLNGETVEAKLASGKSYDSHIGGSWDQDLHEGSNVRIKYLPEKPNYVIRVPEA